MGSDVDIKSFWTEGYAGQIPNSGHELAIYVLWLSLSIQKLSMSTSNITNIQAYFEISIFYTSFNQ